MRTWTLGGMQYKTEEARQGEFRVSLYINGTPLQAELSEEGRGGRRGGRREEKGRGEEGREKRDEGRGKKRREEGIGREGRKWRGGKERKGEAEGATPYPPFCNYNASLYFYSILFVY